MTVEEIEQKISLLKTSNGKQSYLQTILRREGLLQEATASSVRCVIADLNMTDPEDYYSAYEALKNAPQTPQRDSRLERLADLYATSDKSNGAFYAAQCMELVGRTERALEIRLLDADRSTQTSRLEKKRVEVYTRLGLSENEAVARVVEQARIGMQERMHDADALWAYCRGLDDLGQAGKAHEVALDATQRWLDGQDFTSPYRIQDGTLFRFTTGADQAGLALLERMVEVYGNEFRMLDENAPCVAKTLSEAAQQQAWTLIARGILEHTGHQYRHPAISAYRVADQHDLDDPVLWTTIGQALLKQERYEFAAPALDRGSDEAARTLAWTNYADSVIFSEQEVAAHAYRRAGLAEPDLSQRIAFKLMEGNSGHMIAAKRWIQGVASSEDAYQEMRATVVRRAPEIQSFESRISLYEAYGLTTEAVQTRKEQACAIIERNRTTPEDLQRAASLLREAGESDDAINTILAESLPLNPSSFRAWEEASLAPAVYARLGERAHERFADAERTSWKGEYAECTRIAYERAGFGAGTAEQRGKLALAYENSGRGLEAVKLWRTL